MITKIVPFYGDQLVAMQDVAGVVRVAVKPMSDALGLDHRAQIKRLQRAGWACVSEMDTQDAGGRVQKMAALDLDSVPMWLAGVQVTRIHPDLREKLLRYQREAKGVLARAFLRPEAPVSLGEVEDLRRRMAELESRQWGFVYAQLLAQDQRLGALERATKQLRAGARVQATGRRGGSDRKVKQRAPRSLPLALTPPVPQPLPTSIRGAP